MNIHLPAILMWTEGVQGFDTLPFYFFWVWNSLEYEIADKMAAEMSWNIRAGDSWAKNLAIWFLMVPRTWTLNNQTEQEEIWTSKWTWKVPKQNSVKVHFARHASYGDHQSHAKSPLMSPVVSYRNNCHHFRIISNLPIFAGEIAHLPDLQAFAASTNALLGWVRQLRALEAWMLSSIVHLTSLSNLSTYVYVYIWIYYMYGYSISISTYTMYVMYTYIYIRIYVSGLFLLTRRLNLTS